MLTKKSLNNMYLYNFKQFNLTVLNMFFKCKENMSKNVILPKM